MTAYLYSHIARDGPVSSIREGRTANDKLQSMTHLKSCDLRWDDKSDVYLLSA